MNLNCNLYTRVVTLVHLTSTRGDTFLWFLRQNWEHSRFCQTKKSNYIFSNKSEVYLNVFLPLRQFMIFVKFESYFYLNIKTGVPSATLRQRTIYLLEHDIDVNEQNKISLLGEYHTMPAGNVVIEEDDIEEVLDLPTDYGLVFGVRLKSKFKNMRAGSFNDFTIRYGSRIANGGDGGLSQTSRTYGAPNLEELNFKSAYSVAIVNHAVFNISENSLTECYFNLFIYNIILNTNTNTGGR